MKECLDHYSAVSGQKINADKSHFSIDEKHSQWAPQIKVTSGFQQGELPFLYLGVPIFRGTKRTSLFLFLREKISKVIHSWSHRYLSFGGRLTLIKSTLGAIPLHIFQVIEQTNDAMKQMESLIARFFWDSSNDIKRTHWISLDHICHPIEEGGLGVRKFKEMVLAFGMKLSWRFRAQDSLWAHFMLRKYCHQTAPNQSRSMKSHSPTWRRMVRARSLMLSHLKWCIGEGEMDFWDDIWLKDHPIRHYCNPNAVVRRAQVKDFWRNNRWDENRIRRNLIPLGVPNEIVAKILTTPVDSDNKDFLRWGLTPHGNFTTTSAWNTIRHQQPQAATFRIIWYPALSPSISIFVWRLMANRVPVDTKLQWRKI